MMLKKELTIDEFKKVVDDSIELGVKRFYITGGEPFIKEGIFDLIKYIGWRKNCRVRNTGNDLRGHGRFRIWNRRFAPGPTRRRLDRHARNR